MNHDLLVLHAIRLRGFSSTNDVAARFDLDSAAVSEALLDQQAYGRVSWHEFGSSSGWSLTESGKVFAEKLLAASLDEASARARVEQLYDEFLPVNARLRDAIAHWQVRPTDSDPFAANDHNDYVWDSRVFVDLRAISKALTSLESELVDTAPRFGGYSKRFARALHFASDGEREWVDGVGIDSCHTVWFELHEDFLATLGRRREA